ncbi:FAD binding domain-containing protein [Suillus clintonianus]|uniref:FAD binding domain-containing protein n=1 Tax=Suillus clintonianus TaxID=1904413 RepID=UPI001B85EDFF|nr:FAD binding domain-containing protein [Suillus clintonianus]KAG2144347.1 FAD binding domain-containing protein [Suillus clintonianus]
MESHVDVLIVGAGPAGVMCANALAAAGVHVKIVDQRPLKVSTGQADGIQPRTIEVLQSYGLAERLLKEGCQMHMCAFYNPDDGGVLARTGRAPDITAPTARYPFEVLLNQGAVEQIFVDSMASHGLTVDRPIVPASIELSDDSEQLEDPFSYPVKVTLDHLDTPGKQEIVHARYVVGCDGAHSWVRKTLNITMDGEQTDYIWGVVDIVADTDFPDVRNRSAIHSTNGSCMIIPREGDKVRFYIQLSDSDVLDPVSGRVDKNRMSPEKLLDVARKILHPYKVDEPKKYDWWTIYIIGQRVASRFSVNERIFIAGDACHTHSPKAGQGMNASMNDTHNLAWKLAQVLRGRADISLLKTYELERRKYAQDLIDFDREFSTLFSGKPRTVDNDDGVSHEQFLRAFQAGGGFTSGIGVHYMPSAITNATHQQCAPHLIIGERMPPQVFVRAADARPYDIQDMIPSDTRFKLLFFVGHLTEDRVRELKFLSEGLSDPSSFLQKYGYPSQGVAQSMFDIITIMSGDKGEIEYTRVPALLRPHWSKVLLDDTDVSGKLGGGAYKRFGIDPRGITLVVIRPDGYVGMIAPASALDDVDNYFAAFTIPQEGAVEEA